MSSQTTSTAWVARRTALTSLALANIGLRAVDERRLGALHIAQPNTMRRQRVRSLRDRSVADRAIEFDARVVQPQKRDHVVLIHSIAGHADTANQRVASIDRYASGENLDSVGNTRIGTGSGAVRSHVGATPENEHDVLQNRVVDEVVLEAGGKWTPLPRRLAERAVRRSRQAVWKKWPRHVA